MFTGSESQTSSGIILIIIARLKEMAKDFNNPVVVEGYDAHIRKLIPGYELIHLQVHAVLKSYVSTQAKILVVGCGTGYELQYLAEQFPHWSFTAIDPAANMIDKAKQHIADLGLCSRIQFVQGDTSVLKQVDENFDVALAILVSHFVPVDAKAQFLKDIANHLSSTGLCLSYELMEISNTKQLQALKNLSLATGLTEKQAQLMTDRIEQDFALISVDEMSALYLQAGFKRVENFAQVLNYHGFIAFKTD